MKKTNIILALNGEMALIILNTCDNENRIILSDVLWQSVDDATVFERDS